MVSLQYIFIKQNSFIKPGKLYNLFELDYLKSYKPEFFTWYFKKNILAEKAINLKYIFYRIARPVLKVNYTLFRKLNQPSPWLSPTSTLFFKKYLTGDMIGLEYGSGFSTLFYAQRVKQMEVIEHHKGWYEKIKNILKEKQLDKKVNYHLIEPNEETINKAPSFFNEAECPENFSWRKIYYNYFEHVKTYPDEHFEFIIVDGRARVECSFNALAKLKKGGLFILDNSERLRYQPVFSRLKNWEMVNTSNGLTDTTLWLKP